MLKSHVSILKGSVARGSEEVFSVK